MAGRRRPAAASRILATGIAVGAFGGTIGLLAGHAPEPVVREVAVAVPGPTRVVWVEVHHRLAPSAATAAATPRSAPTNAPATRTAVASASPTASSTAAPNAPSIAPAPPTAPPPVATTNAS
jgi:hypothetical protein